MKIPKSQKPAKQRGYRAALLRGEHHGKHGYRRPRRPNGKRYAHGRAAYLRDVEQREESA